MQINYAFFKSTPQIISDLFKCPLHAYSLLPSFEAWEFDLKSANQRDVLEHKARAYDTDGTKMPASTNTASELENKRKQKT